MAVYHIKILHKEVQILILYLWTLWYCIFLNSIAVNIWKVFIGMDLVTELNPHCQILNGTIVHLMNQL